MTARIVLDAMGGDNAPAEIIAGALMAAGGLGVELTLVGRRAAIEAELQGDQDGARELDDRLAGLHTALFVESNPIPAKWALGRLGLIGPGIRLPLVALAEPYHATVLAAMRRAGVIE